MKRISIAITVALLLSACSSAQKIAPEQIDTMFRNEIPGNYPARKYTPMPWAVGQYIKLGITDKDKERSVMKMALVGKDGDAWILESVFTGRSGENVSQMAIKGLDGARKSGSTSEIEIMWIKVRDEKGKIQTFDAEMLRFMKGAFSKPLEKMVTDTTKSSDGGRIQVPAGTFASTTRYESETKGIMGSVTTNVWVHPSVPLSSLVKSTDDDGNLTELIAFGFDAKPVIPLK